MAKLDVNALLQKNPQVDRNRLEELERQIHEARKFVGKKAEQPVAPPYGGRRIISDEGGKLRARIGIMRRHVEVDEAE